jgi:hypothetical protein
MKRAMRRETIAIPSDRLFLEHDIVCTCLLGLTQSGIVSLQEQTESGIQMLARKLYSKRRQTIQDTCQLPPTVCTQEEGYGHSQPAAHVSQGSI